MFLHANLFLNFPTLISVIRLDFMILTKSLIPKKKSQVLYHFCYRAQVVGWPPIRSFRKNSMATQPPKNTDDADGKLGSGCLYVKVSMDGAPYLRKVDLKTYGSYVDLSSALEKMFSSFTIGILFEASPADLGWFSIFNNSCP